MISTRGYHALSVFIDLAENTKGNYIESFQEKGGYCLTMELSE